MGGWGGDVGFCVLRSRSGDGGGSEFLRSLAQSSRAPRTREGARSGNLFVAGDVYFQWIVFIRSVHLQAMGSSETQRNRESSPA